MVRAVHTDLTGNRDMDHPSPCRHTPAYPVYIVQQLPFIHGLMIIKFICKVCNTDRYRPYRAAVSAEGGRNKKREKKKREKKRKKKNLGFDATLRSRDPSPAGDFFSPREEKKHLHTWGEGTKRTSNSRPEIRAWRHKDLMHEERVKMELLEEISIELSEDDITGYFSKLGAAEGFFDDLISDFPLLPIDASFT
ncbi:hypothetical protein BHE74_00010520 [Ensete ventricosum]|nr:hypothetical protein BHE74_00010520 [Ensete ventricosum]RZR91014.1 hypothetical protein BHM03_00019053 [Ensete ventricosum]